MKVMEGRYFEATISTVIFNGKSGDPSWPAIPKPEKDEGEEEDEDERMTVAEQQNIVSHAKEVLRQRWAPRPIPHKLITKGWPDLPKAVFKLPQHIANPIKKKPVAKAIAKPHAPKPCAPKWRSRMERVAARR